MQPLFNCFLFLAYHRSLTILMWQNKHCIVLCCCLYATCLFDFPTIVIPSNQFALWHSTRINTVSNTMLLHSKVWGQNLKYCICMITRRKGIGLRHSHVNCNTMCIITVLAIMIFFLKPVNKKCKKCKILSGNVIFVCRIVFMPISVLQDDFRM